MPTETTRELLTTLADFLDTQDGKKMVGMFGMDDPDSQWSVIADVDLSGSEPDWDSIA